MTNHPTNLNATEEKKGKARYEPTEREKLIDMQLAYIIGEVRSRARSPHDAWVVEFLTNLKWKIKTGEPLI